MKEKTIKKVLEIKRRPSNGRNAWYVQVEHEDGTIGPRMLDVSQFSGLCLRLRAVDPALVCPIPPDKDDAFAINFCR